MKCSLVAALVPALPFALSGQARSPIRIVLAGDSTVNGQGGWRPGFRTEGLWDPAVALKSDYILIQFGHNDVPGKGPDRQTDAPPPTARTLPGTWMRHAPPALNPCW